MQLHETNGAKMYYIRSPEIIYRKEPNGGTVFNRRTTIAREINLTAARIFECCDGDKTVNDIAKVICEEFENVDFPIALRDTKNVLEKMFEHKLIVKSEDKVEPEISYYEKYKGVQVSGIRRPLWADIEFTLKCNLKCVHCSANAGFAKEKELTTAECKKMLDDIQEAGIIGVTFTGGEALMRDDVFELAEYAKKIGLAPVLFSNGFFIDNSNAKKIKELFSIVQISIDGSTPEMHDKFRGVPTSWKRATNAVRMLAELGHIVMVSSVMTSADMPEMRKRVELAISLGAPIIRLGFAQPMGRGAGIVSELTPDQTRSFVAAVLELSKEYQQKIAVDIDEPLEDLFNLERWDKKVAPRKMCGAAIHRIAIDPEGNVKPCILLGGWPEFTGGNVRERTVWDIIENSEIFKLFRSMSVDQFERCGICTFKYACGGSCRAIVYLYNKDRYPEKDRFKALYATPPHCFEFKEIENVIAT